MRVAITRIDPSLPLPVHATAGAAGFDFYCRERRTIEPGTLGMLPANVVVAVPFGYVLLIVLRSSTPRRRHLLIPHGMGVIDSDYRGPEDEVVIQVYNFGENAVTIERGERIAQGLLVPIEQVEWEETAPRGENRGGFGSTG